MKLLLKSFYTHFLDFAYPKICVACEKQSTDSESAICVDCLWNLPRTNSHISGNNVLEYKLWGKLETSGVYSFLSFSKRGYVQNILHSLKYRNNTALGIFLGRLYASDLKSNDIFDEIDYLVPVPLHSDKLKSRGYNQAECIAKGIGEVLNVKVLNSFLIRTKTGASQTKKLGRFNRFKNLSDAFEISAVTEVNIKGKTVALVDDVLTTGSTVEAAGQELLKNGVSKLYILTIASAL